MNKENIPDLENVDLSSAPCWLCAWHGKLVSRRNLESALNLIFVAVDQDCKSDALPLSLSSYLSNSKCVAAEFSLTLANAIPIGSIWNSEGKYVGDLELEKRSIYSSGGEPNWKRVGIKLADNKYVVPPYEYRTTTLGSNRISVMESNGCKFYCPSMLPLFAWYGADHEVFNAIVTGDLEAFLGGWNSVGRLNDKNLFVYKNVVAKHPYFNRPRARALVGNALLNDGEVIGKVSASLSARVIEKTFGFPAFRPLGNPGLEDHSCWQVEGVQLNNGEADAFLILRFVKISYPYAPVSLGVRQAVDSASNAVRGAKKRSTRKILNSTGENVGQGDSVVTVIEGDGDGKPKVKVVGKRIDVTQSDAGVEMGVFELVDRDELEIDVVGIDEIESATDEVCIGSGVPTRGTGTKGAEVVEGDDKAANIPPSLEGTIATLELIKQYAGEEVTFGFYGLRDGELYKLDGATTSVCDLGGDAAVEAEHFLTVKAHRKIIIAEVQFPSYDASVWFIKWENYKKPSGGARPVMVYKLAVDAIGSQEIVKAIQCSAENNGDWPYDGRTNKGTKKLKGTNLPIRRFNHTSTVFSESAAKFLSAFNQVLKEADKEPKHGKLWIPIQGIQ